MRGLLTLFALVMAAGFIVDTIMHRAGTSVPMPAPVAESVALSLGTNLRADPGIRKLTPVTDTIYYVNGTKDEDRDMPLKVGLSTVALVVLIVVPLGAMVHDKE